MLSLFPPTNTQNLQKSQRQRQNRTATGNSVSRSSNNILQLPEAILNVLRHLSIIERDIMKIPLPWDTHHQPFDQTAQKNKKTLKTALANIETKIKAIQKWDTNSKHKLPTSKIPIKTEQQISREKIINSGQENWAKTTNYNINK